MVEMIGAPLWLPSMASERRSFIIASSFTPSNTHPISNKRTTLVVENGDSIISSQLGHPKNGNSMVEMVKDPSIMPLAHSDLFPLGNLFSFYISNDSCNGFL